MNIDQLLTQSLQLLGLGMGSVFIILGLLIGIILLVSKLVPEELPHATTTPEVVVTDNHAHIAAIQAAIHQYRRSRGN
jgi:oxaloacetate decarboxylase gamma subunit